MRKIARMIYLAASWLFLVGIAVQVFLAGMVVVARLTGWGNHISLGHFLGAPLILMLVFQYVGRLPGRMKWLTWLLFGVYFIQADVVIFLRFDAPVISAFHPVLALADAVLGWSLARQAWVLVKESKGAGQEQTMLEQTAEFSQHEQSI